MPGHRPVLDDAIELLERALSYTRAALLTVTDDHLPRPTPCAAWDLDQLLDHMDDGLDAFTDAASGAVDLQPPWPPLGRSAGARVVGLQSKACTLLAVWSRPVPDLVEMGDRSLMTAALVRTAALEIAVHGWDVATTTGSDLAIPDAFAEALLEVARTLVTPEDRGELFAASGPAYDAGSAEARLLAFLGRSRTRPAGQDRTVPGTDPRAAS